MKIFLRTCKDFQKNKIETLTGTVEKAVVKGNKVEITVKRNGETKKLTAERVLNAIGVSGNVTGFGLEKWELIFSKIT